MTRRYASSHRRVGFTLLEMMLALAIGIILMVGLYFMLDMNLRATDEGRTQVDQAEVARYVLKTVETDIKNSVALIEAYPAPTKAGAAATTTTTTTPPLPLMPFNYGVKGDNNVLTLFVSRVSKSNKLVIPAAGAGQVGVGDSPLDSDLRRVSYWLVPNAGLARQEVVCVTDQDAINELPPDVNDAEKMVLNDQVIGVIFQYYDGILKEWADQWDGTAPGPDGVTPVGPPRMIAITVYVAQKDVPRDVSFDDPRVRMYRHEVSVPAASYYANITTGGTP